MPSGVTSRERGAVQDDGKNQGALRGRTFRFLGVIPGHAQREPGIQFYLLGTRLDPGSALRAVRDDITKKGRVVWDDLAFLLSSPRMRGSSQTRRKAAGSRLGAARRPG